MKITQAGEVNGKQERAGRDKEGMKKEKRMVTFAEMDLFTYKCSPVDTCSTVTFTPRPG